MKCKNKTKETERKKCKYITKDTGWIYMCIIEYIILSTSTGMGSFATPYDST